MLVRLHPLLKRPGWDPRTEVLQLRDDERGGEEGGAREERREVRDGRQPRVHRARACVNHVDSRAFYDAFRVTPTFIHKFGYHVLFFGINSVLIY